MERKVLEEYLRIYPEINEEIHRLEMNIRDLKKKKRYYESIDTDERKYIDSIIDSINEALRLSSEALEKNLAAKKMLDKSIPKMDIKRKKIIELRFWRKQYRPMKWSEVAAELNYSVKHVEKIYRKVLNDMLVL